MMPTDFSAPGGMLAACIKLKKFYYEITISITYPAVPYHSVYQL